VSGSPHTCEGQFALDTESRLHSKDGQRIHHGIWTAAFAEYAIVHQSQVVRVPESIPFDCAALLGCGVITGFGAVVNTARVAPLCSIVVIGAGGVGLNTIQAASLCGARPVIAVDLLDQKLMIAQAFGATHGVNAAQSDAVESVMALTAGRGADYVFVTVGSSSAISQGLALMRKRQGTLVIVGIPGATGTVSLPVLSHVWGERKVIGSWMGSSRLGVDVPRLVQLYHDGRLKLDELITGRYPLEGINEAIRSTESGEALRNVIVFPAGRGQE